MHSKGKNKRVANGDGSNAPFKKPRVSGQTRMAIALGAQAPRFPYIEKKQKDSNATSVTIASLAATWSALTLLNGIASGVGPDGRLGRRLNMKSLMVRWIHFPQTIAGSFIGDIRILVIYDRNPQGALPAITDILSVDSITGIMNLNNSDRFMVLIDDLPCQTQGRMGSAGSPTLAGKYHRKFNLQSQYDESATGGIADITCGAIYFMWCASASTGATNGTTITFSSRVRYTDA